MFSCVDAQGSVTYTASETLDWTGYAGSLPSGVNCTMTEIPDTSDLPTGCVWEAPVFSNGSTISTSSGGWSLVNIENKAVCQNVNMTDFKIEKTFLNNGSCINSSSGLCEFQIVITNNLSLIHI